MLSTASDGGEFDPTWRSSQEVGLNEQEGFFLWLGGLLSFAFN